MSPHPLTWDDGARIRELVRTRWAVDGAAMRIGDFYWTLRNTSNGDPLGDAWTWPRPDGSLAAFAWLDAPDRGDAIVAPDAGESMLDEALTWLEEQSKQRSLPTIGVVALHGDERRAAALARRGYAPGPNGNVRFSMRLEPSPDTVALPAGYALRHVSQPGDVERRAFVESNSFGSTVTADAWRLLMNRLPTYRAELDLIAVAPDGTGASACTVWYDDTTQCGEFEAVGTSTAYRRRGIGKAVIIEGLRRLSALGATRAIVETTIGNTAALALYRSCGFEFVAEDHAWTKRL